MSGAGTGSSSSSTSASTSSLVDAHIDSQAKVVVMGIPSRGFPQQMADKSRDLTSRSSFLASHLVALVQDQTMFIKQKSEYA